MSHGGNAQRNGILTAIAFALLVFGALYNIYTIQSDREPEEQTVSIHGQQFDLVIADTEHERKKGLAGVKDLKHTEGMAFLFPVEGEYAIWMKDMEMAIDILWVANGTVVQITPNVQPEPDTPDAQLTRYSPDTPVSMVIELPAGAVESQHIKKGDSVELSSTNSQ